MVPVMGENLMDTADILALHSIVLGWIFVFAHNNYVFMYVCKCFF